MAAAAQQAHALQVQQLFAGGAGIPQALPNMNPYAPGVQYQAQQLPWQPYGQQAPAPAWGGVAPQQQWPQQPGLPLYGPGGHPLAPGGFPAAGWQAAPQQMGVYPQQQHGGPFQAAPQPQPYGMGVQGPGQLTQGTWHAPGLEPAVGDSDQTREMKTHLKMTHREIGAPNMANVGEFGRSFLDRHARGELATINGPPDVLATHGVPGRPSFQTLYRLYANDLGIKGHVTHFAASPVYYDGMYPTSPGVQGARSFLAMTVTLAKLLKLIEQNSTDKVKEFCVDGEYKSLLATQAELEETPLKDMRKWQGGQCTLWGHLTNPPIVRQAPVPAPAPAPTPPPPPLAPPVVPSHHPHVRGRGGDRGRGGGRGGRDGGGYGRGGRDGALRPGHVAPHLIEPRTRPAPGVVAPPGACHQCHGMDHYFKDCPN